MTVFDYVVILILGISIVLGFMRGVVKEVLALAAWVVAFLLARVFAADLAPNIGTSIESPSLRMLVAFLVVFAAGFIGVTLLSMLLTALLKKVGLGPADRGLGVLFGAIRGVAIVLILVLLGGMTALPREPSWRAALTSGWFESLALAVKPWLPKEMARRINYGQEAGA